MRHKIGSTLWDIYSPVYDIITRPSLNKIRKVYINKALESDDPDETIENILIIGVGTGDDIEHIPDNISVTAIDYSQKMLDNASKKYPDQDNLKFVRMDAHDLNFPDNSFQRIVMPLIVAVLENPDQLIAEAKRVLKPGGRIIIFDKFLAKGKKPSTIRKFVNTFANLFATQINLDLYQIVEASDLKVISDEPALFNGLIRVIVLKK